MRIAFDVSYIQKNRAGIGRHALQLAKALREHDTRNEYVLHGWSFGLDVNEIGTLQAPNVSLSLKRIPGDLKRFYWNRLRKPPVEAFVGSIDIFHSTDPMVPPARRAKRIATVHDCAYKKFPALFESRVLAWDAYVQRALGVVDAIVVPSEQTMYDVIELFKVEKVKLHVIHPPVDDMFAYQRDSSASNPGSAVLAKPYILFVGTIEPRKNIASIIKAFEYVRREQRDSIDLVIVGKKGWLFEETMHAIRTSSEKASIQYREYVSEDELACLYRQAICFVYPSLYEGYGFPVLEAMASGVPVITSNNSAMREFADGVALLVPPDNIQDIADAIHLLVTNEVRRVEMRQRGLHVIKQFSSRQAARALLTLYDALKP
ncbi:MAG: glycosyltransferase family 4 protein [Bacteroidetes bacterium]|nr:glycosyltransferase family 4 protein [Bacteroidota bacterium]MCW5896100.1 glycosyltransferase family 4 protein [Bacteroidota bacterium]